VVGSAPIFRWQSRGLLSVTEKICGLTEDHQPGRSERKAVRVSYTLAFILKLKELLETLKVVMPDPQKYQYSHKREHCTPDFSRISFGVRRPILKYITNSKYRVNVRPASGNTGVTSLRYQQDNCLCFRMEGCLGT
jgi:hypothetical protein